MEDRIILEGLTQNNLKNISLSLPKEKLIVFCGLSGSGKSSVVFSTLAAESRRQMTRNFSQYLRRHMPLFPHPEAESLRNLSPALVVEQRPIGANARSDLGSYTEIGPLIRLLFSRAGVPSLGSATDYSKKSAVGRCPTCEGKGLIVETDLDKLVDENKSLREYAVQFKPLSPSGWQGRWMITGGTFDPDLPIRDWPEEKRRLFFYGPEDAEYVIMPFHTKNGPHQAKWDGLVPRFERLYVNRDISDLKEVDRDDVLAMTRHSTCPTCGGSGLNPKLLTSKVAGKHIVEVMDLELTELVSWLDTVDDPVGTPIAREVAETTRHLIRLGLGYLRLSRAVATLSGGESQRVKIARQLASSLNNLTFIFDEPTAGLHASEVAGLVKVLRDLVDKHNTVVVVEHNPMVIEAADELIELGPGAGDEGGELLFQGPPERLPKQTPTGVYRNRPLALKPSYRSAKDAFSIKNARVHNLKDLSLTIPKGVFVAVCGVSGSGKSSLILDAFYPAHSEDTVRIDQKSIGISSRSTLATYMGIMDDIRKIFAKATGKDPGLFSFNSLGACPDCGGKGYHEPDMAFADPVKLVCESCGGLRYSDEALSYTYRGKNIVDFLRLTAKEALTIAENDKILHRLQTLEAVGLDYLRLGQSTADLSGGELQRLKLASRLQYEGKIYLIDEPATGLHPRDAEHILRLFDTIVDRGNSLIIMEHNLRFLAAADWIIELGPEGGKRGGHLLFEGTPEALLCADTPTAHWFKKRVRQK